MTNYVTLNRDSKTRALMQLPTN